MAHKTKRPSLHALACAAAWCCCTTQAWAQSEPVQTVVVTGRNNAPSSTSISGFDSAPWSRTPLSAQAFGSPQLLDAAVASIGGLTRLDASVGDAYNAEGYWSQISVRGYALDNRNNYRRDGLRINAETALPLDNKERMELLKGASGIQAGTSAPGGLVNLVVKRPDRTAYSARVALQDGGSLLGAVDFSDRFGEQGRYGLRVNAAYEHLSPLVRDTQGHRSLLAMAGDWMLSTDSKLEVELERSRQTQPSVAGFSMLGNQVPSASSIDPRINLNRQPWRQPVVLDGDTYSLRWQQRLNPDWRLTVQAMSQSLHSDDRTAFPYGVYQPDYSCPQWCDRYASDGSFSYWEFISNNERRNTRAGDVSVAGRTKFAGVQHQLQAGVQVSRFTSRFQDQVFDLAGPPLGNINGQVDVAPSAGFTSPSTNRTERSTEWSFKDVVDLSASWSLWAGLRHTRLERESIRTSPANDLQPTQVTQSLNTPWLALAHQVNATTSAYASWGQGVESEVVPNLPIYTNRGQALQALKSRQVEVGLKHEEASGLWALTWFDIHRPMTADQGSCNADSTCTRTTDGQAHHRGLEGQWQRRIGAWTIQGSAMLLQAKREGSADASANGLRPVNVPRATLRLGGSYRPAEVPGLELSSSLLAEGDRTVLPNDNATRIPGWARWDASARFVQKVGQQSITWRAGLDNVLNRRAWKESPYEFSHVYLYPMAPRTWRVSAELSY